MNHSYAERFYIVPCPRCASAVGEQCISATKTPTYPHVQRIRASVLKRNQEEKNAVSHAAGR